MGTGTNKEPIPWVFVFLAAAIAMALIAVFCFFDLKDRFEGLKDEPTKAPMSKEGG